MKHDSLYGTTCWCCGHPTAEQLARKFDVARVRVCLDCRNAKGTLLEVRTNRDADVAALVEMRIEYEPLYWSPARYYSIARELLGFPSHFAGKYKCIPYFDEFASTTKLRVQTKEKEYRRNQQREIRKLRKDTPDE